MVVSIGHHYRSCYSYFLKFVHSGYEIFLILPRCRRTAISFVARSVWSPHSHATDSEAVDAMKAALRSQSGMSNSQLPAPSQCGLTHWQPINFKVGTLRSCSQNWGKL
jgi:hypothetical protein